MSSNVDWKSIVIILTWKRHRFRRRPYTKPFSFKSNTSRSAVLAVDVYTRTTRTTRHLRTRRQRQEDTASFSYRFPVLVSYSDTSIRAAYVRTRVRVLIRNPTPPATSEHYRFAFVFYVYAFYFPPVVFLPSFSYSQYIISPGCFNVWRRAPGRATRRISLGSRERILFFFY